MCTNEPERRQEYYDAHTKYMVLAHRTSNYKLFLLCLIYANAAREFGVGKLLHSI